MFIGALFVCIAQTVVVSWHCRLPSMGTRDLYSSATGTAADWRKLVPSASTDPMLNSYLQPTFTFGGCNATSLCLTPEHATGVKEYAAILLPLQSLGAPLPGTVLTVQYTLRYVEGVDDFNLYGFGFRHIVFFSDYRAAKSAIGPSLSMASGSPKANFQYPGFDITQPIASVQRYMANHTCDTTDAADDQTPATTCKFYTSPLAPAPLRDTLYTVTLQFTTSVTAITLASASVVVSGGKTLAAPMTLLNEPVLLERYSALNSDLYSIDATRYIGLVSHRSPLVISDFRVSVLAPLCDGYTQTPATVSVASTLAATPTKPIGTIGTTTTAFERPRPPASTATQPPVVNAPTTTENSVPADTTAPTTISSETPRVTSPTTDVTSSTQPEISANSSTPAPQQEASSPIEGSGSNVALIVSLVGVFVCLAVVVALCTLRRRGIVDMYRRWRMKPPTAGAENSRYELVDDVEMPETMPDADNDNDDDAVLSYLHNNTLPNVAANNIHASKPAEQTSTRRSNSEYGNILSAMNSDYSPLPAHAANKQPIYDSVKPIKTVNYDAALPPNSERPKSQYSSTPPAQRYIATNEKFE